ncbi:monocarboxylate transporter 12-like [Saccoglossus kowalevskii]|uniref:Monocarboxylate transporter 12-like n=1 Tax=Saccoglossus kowalevskii TaxID=10224 RepID=A0ABM0M3X1_SACKO|nr:PREDICTED: monocarboxylate transporter 12-like [Saccoglossus kowalevskii]
MTSKNRRHVVEGTDGGYGWLVVVAGAIVYGLAGGLPQAMGSFFIEFRGYFESTAERTAWVISIFVGCVFASGIVGSFIAKCFGTRPTVFVGGSLAVSGFFISSFATSLEFLYITSGVMPGLGIGMCLPPTLTMVGQYFPKRFAVANGFCMMGNGITLTIVPLIIQASIDAYRSVFDVTQNYDTTFYILVSVFIASGLICIPGVIVNQMKNTTRTARETNSYFDDTDIRKNICEIRTIGVQVDETEWNNTNDMSFILDSPLASSTDRV